MTEKIVINSGLRKYAIENENGEIVAEVVIDANDNSTMERFMDLYDRAAEIEKNFQEEVNALGIKDTKNITTAEAKTILQLNRKAIEDLVYETEEMFGDGLIHDIFKANYENNKDFCPDISAIVSFYEQIVPILTNIFEGFSNSKYSVKKRHK